MDNTQMLLKLKKLAMDGLSSGTDGFDERFQQIIKLTDELIENENKVVNQHKEIYSTILHKLAQEYFRIFYVDTRTDSFLEYDPFDPNPSLDMEHEKEDFFMKVSKRHAPELHPDDVDSFFSGMKKERVLEEINDRGEFSLIYRVKHCGGYYFSNMKGTRIEGDHDHIVVGVKNIDHDVKREKEYLMNLAQAKDEANHDGLTGIRNRHAYLEYVEELKKQIERGEVSEYAVLVFDVNGLKKINDTLGHQAGDRYIQDACRIICGIFKRSPVFRIGGDEFIVITKGDDYVNLDSLIGRLECTNRQNREIGGIEIAAGMARSEECGDLKLIVRRADERMYENKKRMKMNPSM